MVECLESRVVFIAPYLLLIVGAFATVVPLFLPLSIANYITLYIVFILYYQFNCEYILHYCRVW